MGNSILEKSMLDQGYARGARALEDLQVLTGHLSKSTLNEHLVVLSVCSMVLSSGITFSFQIPTKRDDFSVFAL